MCVSSSRCFLCLTTNALSVSRVFFCVCVFTNNSYELSVTKECICRCSKKSKARE